MLWHTTISDSDSSITSWTKHGFHLGDCLSRSQAHHVHIDIFHGKLKVHEVLGQNDRATQSSFWPLFYSTSIVSRKSLDIRIFFSKGKLPQIKAVTIHGAKTRSVELIPAVSPVSLPPSSASFQSLHLLSLLLWTHSCHRNGVSSCLTGSSKVKAISKWRTSAIGLKIPFGRKKDENAVRTDSEEGYWRKLTWSVSFDITWCRDSHLCVFNMNEWFMNLWSIQHKHWTSGKHVKGNLGALAVD